MDDMTQYNALFSNATSSASTQKAAAGVHSAGATAQLKGADQGRNVEQAKQAAEDFEAVFLAQMLGPIFDSLETDGMFGGGSGEKIYRSLLVQEYGKAIAKSSGIGISDAVQSEILKLQEVSQ